MSTNDGFTYEVYQNLGFSIYGLIRSSSHEVFSIDYCDLNPWNLDVGEIWHVSAPLRASD